jgi:hypothetical protein
MGMEEGSTSAVNINNGLLTTLDYLAELIREFFYLTLFGQSFGAMGITPAITEPMISSLSSASVVWMVWTYLIGCLLLIPVALTLNSELHDLLLPGSSFLGVSLSNKTPAHELSDLWQCAQWPRVSSCSSTPSQSTQSSISQSWGCPSHNTCLHLSSPLRTIYARSVVHMRHIVYYLRCLFGGLDDICIHTSAFPILS